MADKREKDRKEKGVNAQEETRKREKRGEEGAAAPAEPDYSQRPLSVLPRVSRPRAGWRRWLASATGPISPAEHWGRRRPRQRLVSTRSLRNRRPS